MTRWIRQLHHDTNGAISVLVLLTIWCLVALIAMLWNTAEYSWRRQSVQNAADAAAHSSAMWMSRSLNAISAQNMVIARDASAEAIWRASISTGGNPNDGSYPQSGSIYGELSRELADAEAGRSRVRGLQQRLKMLCSRIEVEYELTNTALKNISASLNANSGGNPSTQPQTQPQPNQAMKDFANKVRQANSALQWVENTYLNGQSPTAGRPGPPGPNGEGLYQLVSNWNVAPATELAIYQMIEDYITSVEIPILQAFQNQTYAATSQPLDTIMQAHETTVFQQQQSVRANTPNTIDQQKQNIQDFYNQTKRVNVAITLATTKQPNSDVPNNIVDPDQLGLAGSGRVGAPVATPEEADGSIGQAYSDTIRNSQRVIPFSNPPITYQQEAALLQLPLNFDIDPINPHTAAHNGLDGTQWLDATIWHPNIPIQLPGGQLFGVLCNVPGGWGHLWLMPIERYLNDRIWQDQANLRTNFIRPLDKARWLPPHTTDLAGKIWAMQGLPPNPQIAPLPRTLVDDTPNAQGGYDNIPVLPTLTNPPNAQSSLNSQITIYNAHSQAYISFVRQLRTALLLYASAYEEFYVPFAVLQWDSAVSAARNTVMGATPNINGLAQNGTFMILPTYKLRQIPPWARGTIYSGQYGMYDAIREQVAGHIIEMNTFRLVQTLSGGNATGAAIRPYADEAMAMLQAEAYDAAGEIAAEWVNRPWPYEIAPPNADSDNRPPYVPVGIPKDDRQQFFSTIALAVDSTTSNILLPSVFNPPKPMIAYAQGEAFNWMEFNTNFGGNDQFDNAARLPYGTIDVSGAYFGEIGCPRGWRLSTTGGWNWQPRLSISDALPQATQLNPDLQTALQQIGIAPPDDGSFDAINLH